MLYKNCRTVIFGGDVCVVGNKCSLIVSLLGRKNLLLLGFGIWTFDGL
jgi:hypothetical protein